MPITFIYSIGSKGGFYGSKSVIVVRKYLESKFSLDKNQPLIFDSLGPSPFHADFLIKKMNSRQKMETGLNKFITKIDLDPYHKVSYYVRSDEKDLKSSSNVVLRNLSKELDIFYYAMKIRSAMISKRIQSHQAMGVLIEKSASEYSILNDMKNFFTGSNQIKDAIIKVTETEIFELGSKFETKSAAARHEFGENSPVKIRIEEMLREMVSFPAAQYRDLVKFLEDRKRHYDNVLIAIFSALLGGVVGGLLASIAGK